MGFLALVAAACELQTAGTTTYPDAAISGTGLDASLSAGGPAD
jgi:hypothetical protein